MTQQHQEYITRRQSAQMLGVSYRHFRDRLCKEPGFPKPYRISSHKCYWRREELEAWFKSRRMGPNRPLPTKEP